MSNNEPETPKIILNADSLFGKKSEQVTVDSNRLNPISEADKHWLDALAIPPRPCDLMLQALTWLSASTFIFGILNKARIPAEWLQVAGILVLCFVMAAIYGWITFPRLRLFIAYRVFLLGAGGLLGVSL